MTNEKVVGASSLPTIDRGTDARAKMSRKRFLAFMMVGLMIVAAVSMIAPSMLGNNGQDDGNDQTAQISWVPAGKREAIYKVDHLFENYMKDQNYTIADHGGAGAANQNAHPAQEAYLGHHSQTIMGNNEWLNTSAGASHREFTYDEMTLRNNYPYIFYWNPVPTGKLLPTLPAGLATWAPYRLSGVVNNDTALHTGYGGTVSGAADTANVPFIPFMNRSIDAGGMRGGYVNLSMYGTYMTDAEMDDLQAGIHFGNWFYGMPDGETLGMGDNEGYFFELHGTVELSRWALTTFLNWTPGVRSQDHMGNPAALDSTDARTWFAAEKVQLTKLWFNWMYENFSQTPVFKCGNAPYWDHMVNNGNIYTNYEWQMSESGDLHVSLKLDPNNGTTANSLAIRFYITGWGPDAALIRMLEASNLTGSVGKVGVGLWTNRGAMANYGEDVYVNCSIRESMANSSFREVVTYTMIGWEDASETVWNSGYMIELGAHADYIPNVAGQTTYPSPMNKYQYPGAGDTKNDPYTGDTTKSRDWRAPSSLLFNTNASVCLSVPQVRNITAYEAIIVDLNLLSSPWLAGLKAQVGEQTMALQPFQGTSATCDAGMTAKLNRWLYWGGLKLGEGSYPQTEALGMYDASTKILNLSGGTTGITMGDVFNQDYWGGNPGQASRIYHRALPFIQLDVAAVDHYEVTLESAVPYKTSTNYWVKATPVDATGAIPRNMNGKLIVNDTITFSTNNPGTTWPGNGTSVTFNNVTNPGGSAWTTVNFATAKDNTYVNVTNVQFGFSVGGLNGAPVMTQAQTGSIGPMVVDVPEFAMILIPIVGMMAMFFIFRTRKRKREE